MTITINTKTVIKSLIIFSAGVIYSDKIKSVIRKGIKKKTNKVKVAVNNKTENVMNNINNKLHKAVDICFDKSVIDVPIN